MIVNIVSLFVIAVARQLSQHKNIEKIHELIFFVRALIEDKGDSSVPSRVQSKILDLVFRCGVIPLSNLQRTQCYISTIFFITRQINIIRFCRIGIRQHQRSTEIFRAIIFTIRRAIISKLTYGARCICFLWWSFGLNIVYTALTLQPEDMYVTSSMNLEYFRIIESIGLTLGSSRKIVAPNM